MQKFLKCKSYAEIGRLLGYNYYNGTVKRKIIEFCNENNLNLDLIIKSNCNKPNKCLFCGKEIEGKQHKYKDRVESDKIRDAFIKSKGIEVYRVDWNSINTEKGSDLMKSKIESFLSFYNTKYNTLPDKRNESRL